VLHLSHPTHFFEPSSLWGITFSQWSCSVFDKQRRDHRFSDLFIQRESEPNSFRPIGEGGRVLHSRQVPSDSDSGIYVGDSFSVIQREGIPAVGQITFGSDREIREPSSSRSIQGESCREEGDFIGTNIIRFRGGFLVHASYSSFGNGSSATCNNKPTHVTDWDCMPMI
jgi:hypothetical protein